MKQLNVPLAMEKSEGPSIVLSFFLLELDSRQMVVCLPLPKTREILITLGTMLLKEKCTLKEMQSLIVVLNFACRAILPG